MRSLRPQLSFPFIAVKKMYHNTEQVSKNDTETETRKKERVVQ